MGVDVDEPGQDVGAARVEGAAGRSGTGADLRDAAVLDRDVAGEGRPAGAVDHEAACDLEVEHRSLSFTL